MSFEKMCFYQGLLFALAERCRTIRTKPITDFHNAFGEMVAVAKTMLPEDFLAQIRFDPIFGTYDEASEMWLEGSACLLLHRSDTRVTFQMDPDEASKELDRLPQADAFRQIADVFLGGLDARKLVEMNGT